MAKSVTLAKTANPKPAPAKEPVVLQDQTQAPATTEKPKAKARKVNNGRSLPIPADTAVILFNEAAHQAKPKRGASLERMAMYNVGPEGTVVSELRKRYADFRYKDGSQIKGAKAFCNGDLRWNLAHGFISVKA